MPVNARLRSVVRHQRSARRDQFAITPHSVYPCLVIVSRAPLGDARKQRITQAFRSVVRHQRSARQDQVPLCRYMPKIKRLSPVVGSTSFSFVETWCSFPTFLSSFVHWCSFDSGPLPCVRIRLLGESLAGLVAAPSPFTHTV